MSLTLPKFTVFFQQNNGAGWSESFYVQTAPDMASLKTIATAYMTQRIGFLASDCWVTYIRFGDSAVKRYVDAVQFGSDQTQGQIGDTTNYSNDAANIRLKSVLSGGTFHRRSLLLRGIPDGVVNAYTYRTTGGINTASAWYVKATSFFTTFGPPILAIRYSVPGNVPPYALAALDTFIVRRATTRKAGRPFGLPPGRRLTT